MQRRRLSKERSTRHRRRSKEASEASVTPPPVPDMAAIARPLGGGGSPSLRSLFLFTLVLSLSLPSAASAACRADVKLGASKSSGKADIVWWIDTSGSMGEEAKYLKANINNFATYIEKAGIDYRIILVGYGLGVCFKPPLGGKDCEDSNLPKYTFVKQTIFSYVSVTQRTHSSLPKPPPAPAQACIRIIDPTLINHNGKRHASRIHHNITPRTNVHILLCTLFTGRPL